MTDPHLGDAYRQAFGDTEDDAIQRMRSFVHTLPAAQEPLVHRARWALPVGVAAAVAVIAVTTVTITASGSNPARPAGAPPAGALPAMTANSSAPPSPPRPIGASSTASEHPLPPRSSRSTAPSGPASTHPTAPVPPPAPTPASTMTALTPGVSTVTPTPLPPTVSSHAATTSTQDTTTYPTIGDPGITGPLARYAKAAAYTKVPAGLAVRTPADDVSSQNGVATGFSMYISAPNHDPKVVMGGYLVTVTAPSIHYQSIDGQGPSTTPTGPELNLGDRIWHWNSSHTLLISTSADADLYIGVLATRAMNEYEPTIPTGYSTADIELIAAGLHT